MRLLEPRTKNPNIADVDVLQIDAASETSSMEEEEEEEEKRCSSSIGWNSGEPRVAKKENGRRRRRRKVEGDTPKIYAYEGGNSSAGSLSPCLESRSSVISDKCSDDFREVAHMAES